jgi:hypothetical protein
VMKCNAVFCLLLDLAALDIAAADATVND